MLGFLFGQRSEPRTHASTSTNESPPIAQEPFTTTDTEQVAVRPPSFQLQEPLDFAVFTALDPVATLLSDWAAPSIVVLGNESAGKSTLLSRLTRVPSFPASMQRCTRCPVILSLRRGPPKPVTVSIKHLKTGVEVHRLRFQDDCGTEGVCELMNEILEIESKEKGRPIAVAGSRAIVMHKQDESSPNLDLIDLPGLVTAGRSGEETVHDETMSLARSYVRNRRESSVFLVVVSAKHQVNESLAMRLVQQEKLEDRCIGVLTNCDKIDSDYDPFNGDHIAALRGRMAQDASSYTLGGGWLATMSRDIKIDGLSLDHRFLQQEMNEMALFSGCHDFNFGINKLRERLELFYHNFLANTWAPNTVKKLQSSGDDLSCSIKRMGSPVIESSIPDDLRDYARKHVQISSAETLIESLPKQFVAAVKSMDTTVVVNSLLQNGLRRWSSLCPKKEPVAMGIQRQSLLDTVTNFSLQNYETLNELSRWALDLVAATAKVFEDTVTLMLDRETADLQVKRFPGVMAKIEQLVGALASRFSSSTLERIQQILLDARSKDLFVVKFALPSAVYEVDESLFKQLSNTILNVWLQGLVCSMHAGLNQISEMDLTLNESDFREDSFSQKRNSDLLTHMRTHVAIEQLQKLSNVPRDLFTDETKLLFDVSDASRPTKRARSSIEIHTSDFKKAKPGVPGVCVDAPAVY